MSERDIDKISQNVDLNDPNSMRYFLSQKNGRKEASLFYNVLHPEILRKNRNAILHNEMMITGTHSKEAKSLLKQQYGIDLDHLPTAGHSTAILQNNQKLMNSILSTKEYTSKQQKAQDKADKATRASVDALKKLTKEPLS